ncbi:hypothetical protein [Coxiella endosymbiont of Ornithodoros maritimus]|uniref:hypothetical protein n=1 Tax=Coxiella endosymbiont of Ornithodoros maritimus TaxID=1656172 RepID=UPI002264706D|nr:hypothetical protein [Coxiella endosymbiont of Ornithodoros maritimus]
MGGDVRKDFAVNVIDVNRRRPWVPDGLKARLGVLLTQTVLIQQVVTETVEIARAISL